MKLLELQHEWAIFGIFWGTSYMGQMSDPRRTFFPSRWTFLKIDGDDIRYRTTRISMDVLLPIHTSDATVKVLTRVGHILKKSHEGHLGVFFDPQKEIVITSELLRIFQPNFTGVSHIWSGIWKYVTFFLFQDGGQHGRRNSESNVSQLSFQLQRQIKCRFI